MSFAFGILVGFVAILVSLQLYTRTKEPIFSHEVIADITRQVWKQEQGKSSKDVLDKIQQELINQYGHHVLSSSEWIFMNCGGWMGSMYLLHASLNEYVLFFALGIDTSGHSGRYVFNITDTLISGTMKQWKEGGLEVRHYKPGDTVYHAPGEVTGVQWTEGTVMVEYGRGFVPYSLPFALADSLFSSVDYYIVFKVIKAYALAMFNEIMLGNF